MKASFGSIIIFGSKYEKDIIIHVDGTITKRNKKKSKEYKSTYGHTPLSEKELDFLEKEKPEIVYIGNGYYSLLPITEKAQKILRTHQTIKMRTPEIIKKLKMKKEQQQLST
jgi:hypothetical protein